VPTRKQRRRRAKDRRHEWEEVYVDDEGREVAPDEVDGIREGEQRRDARRQAASRGGRARTGRTIEPPSWRRVARRALIFAPLMFVVIWFLEPDSSPLLRALSTLQLMVLFIPFSYLVDALTYRTYRKRLERVEGGTAARDG
jgi:hypothetical protein